MHYFLLFSDSFTLSATFLKPKFKILQTNKAKTKKHFQVYVFNKLFCLVLFANVEKSFCIT